MQQKKYVTVFLEGSDLISSLVSSSNFIGVYICILMDSKVSGVHIYSAELIMTLNIQKDKLIWSYRSPHNTRKGVFNVLNEAAVC